ncbi:hypothetical protein DXG01_002430 [Tephrocybe rancida]|nr:hypothetical protein DXG01_002430 [Tephrocybe rancida]
MDSEKGAPQTFPDPEKVAHGTGSVAGNSAEEMYGPALKKVWRKIDYYILPVVSMFYLLSFLDRTNFANARVAGLQKDLNMSNTQYSIALTVTYIPYIFAELPSNLMLKAVGPNLMLPTMLTLWGIVTTLQGIVHDYTGILVCRFFLGLCEGGVFPGLVLYLSFWYPRQQLQWRFVALPFSPSPHRLPLTTSLPRISAFFSTASLSGAFSGILAFGIIHMDGVGNRPGWAWIFILEGLFTVAFGITAYWTLPRSPQHAKFLSEKEKEYVVRMLKETGATGGDEETDKFSWREVGMAFRLPQVWMLAVIFFFDGVLIYGLAYFTPSIVAGLGYTNANAQLFSVPPFTAAFFVTIVGSYISDRCGVRGYVSMFSGVLAIIGFAIYLASPDFHVKWGSLFFSISGAYSAAPALSTWGANNTFPYTRRATAIAIGFIMTNSGGVLATWLLGTISPAPLYTKATITLLAFSVGMVVVTGCNVVYLKRENRRKEETRRMRRREEEKRGLGDRSAWDSEVSRHPIMLEYKSCVDSQTHTQAIVHIYLYWYPSALPPFDTESRYFNVKYSYGVHANLKVKDLRGGDLVSEDLDLIPRL